MENFYYIDKSGFIEYAGRFNSYDSADNFFMKADIQAFMIFHEEYLRDFIKFADQMIKEKEIKE